MSDRIGRMRARVRLESPSRVEDEIGGAAITWQDQGAVWAEIVVAGGATSASYDTAVSVNTFRVSINSRGDIRAGWRVAWGGRLLRITGVRDDGAAQLELQCEEEVR